MSYRPIAISSPLYRVWAAMRLRDMEQWIATWALPEMYAGVPQTGAVDAWHKALTDIEELIANFLAKNVVARKELLSFTGKANHAAGLLFALRFGMIF